MVDAISGEILCPLHPDIWRRKCWKCQADESRRKCLKKYGLTLEDYNEMLAAQGGGCAICGKVYKNKALPVDHNHTTGKVRELLCNRCNGLVAVLERQDDLLGRAIRYLEKHEGKSEVN